MINWDKKFETGLEDIDRQHQMLVLNINHLETQMTSSNPTRAECEFLIHLIDFLDAYATTHFSLEEQCMECNRCRVREANQRAHDNFRSIFSSFKKRCALEGFTVELCRQLHNTASVWIVEHILKIDTQLRSNIRGPLALARKP